MCSTTQLVTFNDTSEVQVARKQLLQPEETIIDEGINVKTAVLFWSCQNWHDRFITARRTVCTISSVCLSVCLSQGDAFKSIHTKFGFIKSQNICQCTPGHNHIGLFPRGSFVGCSVMFSFVCLLSEPFTYNSESPPQTSLTTPTHRCPLPQPRIGLRPRTSFEYHR